MHQLPSVTLIMPVRNEGAFLAQSLAAVLSQDYPFRFLEVVVADGMSIDDTRDILSALQSTHANLRVISNTGQIVSTGLNEAIRQSSSDIVIRVDGHTIVESDYVRQCVETLRRTGANNVGGRMSAVGAGYFGQAVAVATSSPFGVGGARFHYSNSEEWVDTVYMGAWPRNVFERIGLFDEEQVRNQDDEFNYRLLSNGGRILLSPKIRSRYYNRSTIRSLWRQYYQYGFWKVRVMQKHPRQMRLRQFAPLSLILALITSLLAVPFLLAGKWMFGLVVGSYVVANLAASILTVRKKSWRLLPLLSLTFAILHVAYGLGFFVGLARFWNRWGSQESRLVLSEQAQTAKHD